MGVLLLSVKRSAKLSVHVVLWNCPGNLVDLLRAPFG